MFASSVLRSLRTTVALVVATAAPVFAQIDITGAWAPRVHEDLEGELLGDYTGLPINDEARARADAYSGSYLSMPERQCIMFTTHYVVRQPHPLRIDANTDPISGQVTTFSMSGTIDRVPRTIWMDGRPHPSPLARHTAAGFSTGIWQGDTLVVTTTHLAEGILTRNGVPSSDQASIREYIVRHGDRLTITMILYDPVYLEEPYLRSQTWVLDPATVVVPEPCEPAVEVARPAGEVPHYLPGTNPNLTEMADRYGLPPDAVRGGAETLYPEYRKRIRTEGTSSGDER
jgi:hypothetical protein